MVNSSDFLRVLDNTERKYMGATSYLAQGREGYRFITVTLVIALAHIIVYALWQLNIHLSLTSQGDLPTYFIVYWGSPSGFHYLI